MNPTIVYRINLIWYIIPPVFHGTVRNIHGLIQSYVFNVRIKCRIKIGYGVM